MERVLGLPELLQRIFCLLDPASNAANARVCRQWSDLALDMFWRHVDNPYFLFKILAPLGKARNSGCYEFQRLPSSNDWKRFLKYSTKVRVLSFRNINSRSSLFASVLEIVATTRTTLNIFPNLHSLSLEPREPVTTNLCIIFMQANIKSFTLALPSHFEDKSPQYFFEEIHSRMPHLTRISIRSSIPMHAIETEMISLITSLRKLKDIALPRFYSTTKFTEALSRLPDLLNIQFQRKPGHGDPIDVRPFAPDLADDAFPNLMGHSIMATFHDGARFLQTNLSPSNLKRLYIESNINETPPSIHSLLSAVSENCQNLLTIGLVSYPRKNSLPDDNQPGDLNIDILRPLLKLSGLVVVEFVHQYPLALQQKDIELLASSWPSLTDLKLNNHPIHHTTPSSLTLEALIPFAKHCPKLQNLCLYVDADDELVPTFDPITFQSLQKLDMGVSSITEIEHVALYLTSILPPTCKVVATARWDEPDIVDVQVSPELMRRRDAWAEVEGVLPMLWTARLQERERTLYFLLEKGSKLEQSTAIVSDDHE